MDPVLTEADRAYVHKLLGDLPHPVRLVLFADGGEFCGLTRQLAEAVAAGSPQVELAEHALDSALAREREVTHAPTLLVDGEGDTGVRFVGLPAGYEFASLLEAVVDVGRHNASLPDDELAMVMDSLDVPVHIQVFVTPSCPHCPRAVRTAHQLALASPMVRADMVEVSEFPELGERYQVQGVPKTVIDEDWSLLGAQPLGKVVRTVIEAAGLLG